MFCTRSVFTTPQSLTVQSVLGLIVMKCFRDQGQPAARFVQTVTTSLHMLFGFVGALESRVRDVRDVCGARRVWIGC